MPPARPLPRHRELGLHRHVNLRGGSTRAHLVHVHAVRGVEHEAPRDGDDGHGRLRLKAIGQRDMNARRRLAVPAGLANLSDARLDGKKKIGPRSVPRGPNELERRGFFEAQSK